MHDAPFSLCLCVLRVFSVERTRSALVALSHELGRGWSGYRLADLVELAKDAEALDSRVALLDPALLEVGTVARQSP